MGLNVTGWKREKEKTMNELQKNGLLESRDKNTDELLINEIKYKIGEKIKMMKQIYHTD